MSATREDTVFNHLLETFQNSPCDFIGSGANESAASERSTGRRLGVHNTLSNATTAMNYNGANNHMHNCGIVLRLDPDVVGWVIGKNGVHIKRVKQETGCCIWLNQSDLNLHIIGNDPAQEAMAVSHIETLIRSTPIRGGQMNRRSMRNFTTKMIDCPSQLVGLLIGRNGCNIKRIKQESMASITINQVMGKAIICGSPKGTEKAASAIEKIFLDNGFIMDEYGSFMPYHPTIVSSPITRSIDTAAHGPKKVGSAFSVHGDLLYMTVAPGLGISPDSIDTLLDNSPLFSKSVNSFVEEDKVNCDWKAPTWCSTPPSLSDQSSLSSICEGSLEQTPPPLYTEGLAISNSYCRTTNNFATIEELLKSMNLSHHICIFRANEMDMDALRLSSKEDLKTLGLPIGASIKLSAALNIT